MITIKNYINGTYYESSNNEWLEAIDPSIGVVYGKLPNSTDKDVEEAYKAANNAFASWSKTSVEQLSEILYKIAFLLYLQTFLIGDKDIYIGKEAVKCAFFRGCWCGIEHGNRTERLGRLERLQSSFVRNF